MSNDSAAAAAKLVSDSERFCVSLPVEQLVKLLVVAVAAQADDVASIKALIAPPPAPEPAPEPAPVTVEPPVPQAPTDEQLQLMFEQAGLQSEEPAKPATPEGGAQ